MKQKLMDLVAAYEAKKEAAVNQRKMESNSGTPTDPVFNEAQERDINTDFFKDVKQLSLEAE